MIAATRTLQNSSKNCKYYPKFIPKIAPKWHQNDTWSWQPLNTTYIMQLSSTYINRVRRWIHDKTKHDFRHMQQMMIYSTWVLKRRYMWGLNHKFNRILWWTHISNANSQFQQKCICAIIHIQRWMIPSIHLPDPHVECHLQYLLQISP